MSDIAGFDSVELVMSVEDMFGISIPDREAERIMSVGELCRYVAARVRARVDEPDVCPTAAAFYRVRRRVASDSNITADSMRPSTPTATLLSPGDIRNEWRALASRLGVVLPPLRFGSSVRTLIVALWFSAMITFGLVAHKLGGGPGLVCAIVAGPVFTILLAIACPWAARRWGKTIPPLANSAGDLAYLDLVERKKKSSSSDWTECEVETVVRYLVAESAGLPVRRIRRDTMFLELNAITG